MKPGDLYQVKPNPSYGVGPEAKTLVEIVRTWDKRDIDPECLESVAIVGMVEATILSGQQIGKTMRMRRQSFNHLYSKVEEAI